uniref:Vav 3 guanine nucleotide exchange factor b n=1 Tax=Cynoglossus semilaevis TaxID=244447 RepID=A0A3P8WIM5_CYNSE
MVVTRDYSGMPYPQYGPPLSIHVGDVIEVMFADLHSSWWQGKILGTNKTGFFPSDTVKPCPCVPKPVDYSAQHWFAGPMERYQAEVELLDRENRTFLVRHRSKECTEYAISIKFNDKIKHIKILSKDGCFYIAESRLFRTVLDLVDYYRQHSLKEGFSSLDTTLQKPYREMTNGPSPTDVTNASGASSPSHCSLHGSSVVSPVGCSFVPPSSSPFWSGTVFSPRVVGIAVALYDFCSRDTRQLSLLQGDIIKIYSKMSDGWWKGEVGGRVGLFPSTYVEEED